MSREKSILEISKFVADFVCEKTKLNIRLHDTFVKHNINIIGWSEVINGIEDYFEIDITEEECAFVTTLYSLITVVLHKKGFYILPENVEREIDKSPIDFDFIEELRAL